MSRPFYTMTKPGTSARRLTALFWLLLALVPTGVFLTAPQAAQAQSKSFHMSHYDADITVNTDGSMDIVETLAYVFDFGTYRRGSRFIPLDRVTNISNVQVEEVGVGPYTKGEYNPDNATYGTDHTFGTEESAGNLYIRWVHTNFGTSDPKTFKLSYHVTGGIRVYPDYYQLDWNAIPPDWGGNIDASRVTVKLPGNLDASKLDIASKPSVQATTEANSVTWNATNVNSGLEVGIKKIPKEIMQATKPAWQDKIDLQEKIAPFLNIGLTALGFLILIFGPLLTVRKWYKYGRDLPVALHSDYITDPPSDLPPGLVGTLLDEKADVRDVIATIVDQGRKGNLTIGEVQTQGFLTSGRDFQYTQTGSNTQYQYENSVLSALFGSGSPTSLSDLKNSFYSNLPPIYSQMYDQLVQLKYFPENPASVRAGAAGIGVGFLVAAAIVVGASYFFTGGISFFPMIPAVALGITGLVRLGFANAMPRKTDFGSEEAQKWRAFSRYLQEMKTYTNVQTAADKFQKYLPYAVALGIERQLTDQFNNVPSAMPPYYIPYGWYPYGAPIGNSMSGTSAGGGGGNFDPGAAMQGMSDSLGSAMQNMSDSFTSMVNSASSILTSSGSGGGGGWGGGGGSFGGGGGGGGGGGAD